MTINIEKEYKFLINEDQFQQILEKYQFKDKIIQTNYYFDSQDFLLAKDNITLRCREKNDMFYLQAKIKNKNNKNYTSSQELSVKIDSIPDIIDNQFLYTKLTSFPSKYKGITFKKIGLLTTTRHLVQINDLIIHLDKNLYNNTIDFEIEIEFDIESYEKVLEIIKILNLKNSVSINGKKNRFIKSLNNLNTKKGTYYGK